jgi:hypothetical protein
MISIYITYRNKRRRPKPHVENGGRLRCGCVLQAPAQKRALSYRLELIQVQGGLE